MAPCFNDPRDGTGEPLEPEGVERASPDAGDEDAAIVHSLPFVHAAETEPQPKPADEG